MICSNCRQSFPDREILHYHPCFRVMDSTCLGIPVRFSLCENVWLAIAWPDEWGTRRDVLAFGPDLGDVEADAEAALSEILDGDTLATPGEI